MFGKAAFGLLVAGLVAAAAMSAPTVELRPPSTEAPAAAAALEQARNTLANLRQEALLTDEEYAAEVVRSIDLLEPMATPPDVAYGLRNLKAVAYVTMREFDQASALSEVLIKEKPQEPSAYYGAFVGHRALGRADKALAVIERAASAVDDPQSQAMLHDIFYSDGIYGLSRKFLQAKDDASRDRLAEALVKIDWPGASDVDSRDSFRAMAAKAMLKRGDRDGAVALAQSIVAPRPLLGLLILRENDAFFGPDTDRRARIAAALKGYDAATVETAQADPENLETLLLRLQFLRTAGRNSELVALAQPITSDLSKVEAGGESAFWIVNEVAFALVELGRADEGIALINRLLTLDINSHPDLVNMSINKGSVLNRAGRHGEAVTHAITISRTQADFASEYGKMFMAEHAVCGLAAQGRAEEAGPWLAKLSKDEEANEAALIQALLCVNDMGAAERVLLRELASKRPERALAAVQNFEIKKRPDALTPLTDARWEVLVQRPAVVDAINKIGRVIPVPATRSYLGGT